MNHSAPAELRIFTGVHAGARAVLGHGRHVLGADPSCDLVICDEGVADRHAELHIDEASWRLFPLQACEGIPPEGVQLAPGVGIVLGPVVVAMDSANAPWQEAVPLLPVASPAANGFGAEPTPSGELPVSAPIRESTPTGAVAPQPRRSTLVWLGIAVGAVLLALGVATMSWLDNSPIEEKAPVASPADRPEQLRKVMDVLNRLGMAGRADVARRPDGGLVVNATLIEDAEYETLAAALAQLNPRPGLRASSERDLIQSVRDAVAARGTSFFAEYLGSGRFRVKGNVADEEEGKTLLLALAAEFPAARGFDNALLTPAGMAEEMLGLLRESGIGKVRGAWQDETFVVDATMEQSEVALLKKMLAQVDARYGHWLKFTVRIDTPAASQRVEKALPFRLRGIVGGETPYVVLADGVKVLPGGKVGAWRLVEITGEQVIFDGPQRIAVRR